MSWEEEMSCGATKYTSRPQKTALYTYNQVQDCYISVRDLLQVIVFFAIAVP